MNFFSPQKNRIGKRGVALLFSVLIAGLLSAVATSIFSIAKKEAQLSTFAGDSVVAFYAADSLADAAIYYGTTFGMFDNTSLQTVPFGNGNFSFTGVADPVPNGSSVSILFTFSGGTPTVPPVGMSPCGTLLVTKTRINVTKVDVKIIARGRNSCEPTNPRRLERGIDLTY